MVSGMLAIVWALVVWQWQDPVTALYTMYEQHELSQAYDRRVKQFRVTVGVLPTPRSRAGTRSRRPHVNVQAEERTIGRAARAYRLSTRQGEPLGRIIVPRLGLSMIFVNGTNEESLAQGPGRDVATFMPGENRLVYIAGHRTTFLAPFSAINTMRPGDQITLTLPYATFIYKVTGHVIVSATDLSVLHSPAHELLALQACNPRFFATQRYIVYAQPIRVVPAPKLGRPYSLKLVPASSFT
jgi:sortase A